MVFCLYISVRVSGAEDRQWVLRIELNLSPLEGQLVLLTIEPFLQPLPGLFKEAVSKIQRLGTITLEYLPGILLGPGFNLCHINR